MQRIPPGQRYSKNQKSTSVSLEKRIRAMASFGLDPAGFESHLLAGGFMNANYLIKPLQDGKPCFVLRFYSADWSTSKREYDLLKYLHVMEIKVPEVFFIARKKEIPYVIMEYLSGQSLESLLISENPVTLELFESLGLQLAKIHQQTFAQKGFLGPDLQIGNEYNHFGQFIFDFIIRTLQKVPEEKLSKSVADRVIRLVQREWQQVLNSEPEKGQLVHCDFNPKNIFINNGQLVAILDWEFCLSGNGLMDIGNFFRFSYDYPNGAKESFFAGYQSLQSIPENAEAIAKLLDIGNMCSFLERPEDYPETFRTAREVLNSTLEFFNC